MSGDTPAETSERGLNTYYNFTSAIFVTYVAFSISVTITIVFVRHALPDLMFRWLGIGVYLADVLSDFTPAISHMRDFLTRRNEQLLMPLFETVFLANWLLAVGFLPLLTIASLIETWLNYAAIHAAIQAAQPRIRLAISRLNWLQKLGGRKPTITAVFLFVMMFWLLQSGGAYTWFDIGPSDIHITIFCGWYIVTMVLFIWILNAGALLIFYYLGTARNKRTLADS